MVRVVAHSLSSLPSLPLVVTCLSSVNLHSDVTSSGTSFLTPGQNGHQSIGGMCWQSWSKGCLRPEFGVMTLTILLLLIYMKGLGLEFKFDFRVSAYCMFLHIQGDRDFQVFCGGQVLCLGLLSP